MSELFIDYKIDKIIKEIQDEMLSKGELLSYETVKKIIEQQYESTAAGFEQGHTIVLKYFGTFVASRKRVDSLNKQYIKKGLTPMLVDNGFLRGAFKKDGTEIGITTFETQRVSDERGQEDYKRKYKVSGI